MLCFGVLMLLPSVLGGILPSATEYAKKHPNTYPDYPLRSDLFQGDIKLKDDEEVHQQRVDKFNAVWDKTVLWTDNTLYYHVNEEQFTQPQLGRIYEGIALLEQSVMVGDEKCINLIARTTEPNYVNIINENGCWSYVGELGGPQTLSLDNGCHSLHLVQHEFLHALGFYHEHTREDRDDYITVVWENILPEFTSAFEKLIEGVDIDHLGMPYDYDSVLHYHAYSFAIDPEQPTIIPHDPDVDISPKDWLSPIDIEMVQILYSCISPDESKYFKHLGKTVF